MPLLYSLLESFVAIMIGIVIAVGVSYLAPTPAVVADAPAMPAKIIATTTEPIATTTLPVATSSPTATAIPKKADKPAPTKAADPVPKKESVVEPAQTLNEAIQSFADLALGTASTTNEAVRAALVNIICTTESGGPLSSISGSGITIDPRGVILTNAHVAQFFLLRDFPRKDFMQCIVRTGSPARSTYKAELMFLPPAWMDANASKIRDESPTGNGEHDYALIRLTGLISGGPAPSVPFVLTAVNAAPAGTDVLVAGYAAGFLGGITVARDLYASSALSKIRDIYSYDGTHIDLYSLGGSVVAQHGSSGGAVATPEGTLIGVIVTSTDAEDTSARDLRALSTSYIIRDFESERGKSLESALANPAAEAAAFTQTTYPGLSAILINALTGN